MCIRDSPYPAAPDFSTGKRVTRFSGRFAPLRIVFPCHPCSGGRIKHLEASLRKRLCSKHGLLCPRLRGKGGGASHQRGNVFPRPSGRLYGFRRQRRYKKWRRRRRTSPAGTVSQPIGKPFNGQAKGLLWLTWRSYAGPPQYFITPEGGALNPSGRRQPVPDRTLAAQGRKARRLAQPSRP